MTKIHYYKIIEALIGLSSGLAVGAGFIAFLVVLGIIPRLTELSKTQQYVKWYGICVIVGVQAGTYLSFSSKPFPFHMPVILLVIWGGFHGIFNGMLAAALTEILNVFPILSKRIGLKDYLLFLIMAIVFGKIAGSLFQWLILVNIDI